MRFSRTEKNAGKSASEFGMLLCGCVCVECVCVCVSECVCVCVCVCRWVDVWALLSSCQARTRSPFLLSRQGHDKMQTLKEVVQAVLEAMSTQLN